MGIFYNSPRSALPALKETIRGALMVNPANLADVDGDAASRAIALTQNTSPQFNAWRFAAAVVISGALLYAAIWTGQHNLPDISKDLMNSFSGFSGIVLGLLAGEAQKSPSN